MIRKVPAFDPAVNTPPASMKPPVAVHVTPIAAVELSESLPTALKVCCLPAATVADAGATITAVMVGCGGTTVTTAVSDVVRFGL